MPTFGGWACAMPLHPNDDPSNTVLGRNDPHVDFPTPIRFACSVHDAILQSIPQMLILIAAACMHFRCLCSCCIDRLHAPSYKSATSGAIAVACFGLLCYRAVLYAPRTGRINQLLAFLVRLCTVTGLHTTRSPAALAAHLRRRLLAWPAVVLRSAAGL